MKFKRGGVANFLLELIDENFLEFLGRNEKALYTKDEIKDLLKCFSHFVNAVPAYH